MNELTSIHFALEDIGVRVVGCRALGGGNELRVEIPGVPTWYIRPRRDGLLLRYRREAFLLDKSLNFIAAFTDLAEAMRKRLADFQFDPPKFQFEPTPLLDWHEGKRDSDLPACVRCGKRMTEVINASPIHVSPSDESALVAGSVILGPGDDGPTPDWVCLDCEPWWRNVHCLALANYQAQLAKETCVGNADFARAAEHRDRQLSNRKEIDLLVLPWRINARRRFLTQTSNESDSS